MSVGGFHVRDLDRMVGHLLIEIFFSSHMRKVNLSLLRFKVNKEIVPCMSAMDLFFMFAFCINHYGKPIYDLMQLQIICLSNWTATSKRCISGVAAFWDYLFSSCQDLLVRSLPEAKP